MTEAEQGQRLLKKIGASVMAITGGFFLVDENGEDKGDMLSFACSAFAMSFGGVPVLVTAGHVIDDALDPIIVRGEYKGLKLRVEQVNILNCFGENPKLKMPIDFPVYPQLRRGSIDESLKRDSMGLDFGIIFLPDTYWDSFFENDGRILAEDMWATEDEVFDAYKMVGIPSEPEHMKKWIGRISAYSFLRATDPDVPLHHGKPVWFVGNMPMGVETVEGISGGPIFGLRKTEKGWEHKIVAMQSWQKKGKNGLIYGTHLRHFAPVITAAIASMLPPEARSEEAGQKG